MDTLDAYNNDVLEHAAQRPIQMLILGKPKIGKTQFARALAKKIDVVHLEISVLLAKMLLRVKEYEENPETNEEGEVVDKKTAWEK